VIWVKRKPAPPLSDFVEILWYCESNHVPHRMERVLPTGTTELVVNLNEDVARVYDRENLQQVRRLRGTILCGPHSQFFVLDTTQQRHVAGVHFKPGGAFAFFRPPAAEFHNTHVEAEDIWGGASRSLREQLLEQPSPERVLDVLERWLLSLAPADRRRHPAVDYALRCFNAAPHVAMVGSVTDRTGFSARHFIDVFTGQVGITPKRFCRVRRFQRVLQHIHGGHQVRWTDVAAAGGYSDQAHFIHDFRSFSGLTPSDYLAARTPWLNHVPLND